MINIQKTPDSIRIITEQGEKGDAEVRFEEKEKGLSVFLKSEKTHPKFVVLRWNYRADREVRVMGDCWERSYSNLTWTSLNGERYMPWYFIAKENDGVAGCGIMTGANSFVSFEYDASGVTGWFDVRSGGVGVELNGREVLIATVISREYFAVSSFEAACRFCRELCPNPILPDEPVYGGNNWYYAYGKSSAEEILNDTKLIADLSAGNKVKPYMVIDDCWQPVACAGPWVPNEKFGDMKKLSDDMKELGVHTGIWVRLLHDTEIEKEHPDWLLHTGFLDPTLPQVKSYIRETIGRIKGWGYELLKHDFSTVDMFGDYGIKLNGVITKHEGWSFSDRTKTSAEIVLDFYRLIREAAGDMLIIGCNTVSHLCAGLVELNRIGDDTSGEYWNRTRAMGVNTLAFRLCQNGAFYAADADCVGIIPGKIDWSLNSQWTTLLSRSGTPLFISCPNGGLTEEQFKEMKQAFAAASVQDDICIPLDWEYNNEPQKWLINGKVFEFDFIKNSYPLLNYGTI